MKVLLTATVQSHIAQFHRPLIKVLKQEGHEIHVAARNNLNEKNGLSIENVDKIYDISFQRSPFDIRNIRAYVLLRNILRQEQYDLISCNTPVAGVVTRLAARNDRKKGKKVFYTAHGFHFYKGAPITNWCFYYPIERLMALFTDKLITITKEDYKLAKATFSCEVEHIYGVGIDDSRYYVREKSEQGSVKKQNNAEGQIVILCVGELNKNKNQTTVIRGFKYVVESMPNVVLWLAGNGPYEKKLAQEVAANNLEKHVRFLGYRTDLERFTSACDIVVSASFREGLPLNILEAMACGKPVIASINRGHLELVKNGYNGYLFKADEPEELGKYLIDLIENSKKREMFARNGSKVVEKYKASRVEKYLQTIYDVRDNSKAL